jgi:hypothetical protein
VYQMNNSMVIVRTRRISSNEIWIEVLENGSWRLAGQTGDPDSAERMRAEIEDTRMAYVDGRCGC